MGFYLRLIETVCWRELWRQSWRHVRCRGRWRPIFLSPHVIGWMIYKFIHLNDERCAAKFLSVNRLFNCISPSFFFRSIFPHHSISCDHTRTISQKYYCQQLVSELLDLPKNKNGEEICGWRNRSVNAIAQAVEDKLSRMVHDHGGISRFPWLVAIVEEVSDLLLHGSEGASPDPTLWYLDTGATNHMSGCRNFFCELDDSTTGFVKFGDNSRIRIEGKWVIHINQKNGEILWLSNVLYVPHLAANILSLGRLDEEGCRMTMAGGKLTIFDRDGYLFTEVQRYEGWLYLLKLSIVNQCLIITEDTAEDWLWHSWFGHLSFHTLKEMSSKQIIEEIPPINMPNKLCQNCIAGKHHRMPFPKMSSFWATESLELIHTYICGPISPPTLGGSQYFLLIIDDFPRLTWVAML